MTFAALPNAKRPSLRWYGAILRLIVARLIDRAGVDAIKRGAALVAASILAGVAIGLLQWIR